LLFHGQLCPLLSCHPHLAFRHAPWPFCGSCASPQSLTTFHAGGACFRIRSRVLRCCGIFWPDLPVLMPASFGDDWLILEDFARTVSFSANGSRSPPPSCAQRGFEVLPPFFIRTFFPCRHKGTCLAARINSNMPPLPLCPPSLTGFFDPEFVRSCFEIAPFLSIPKFSASSSQLLFTSADTSPTDRSSSPFSRASGQRSSPQPSEFGFCVLFFSLCNDQNPPASQIPPFDWALRPIPLVPPAFFLLVFY